MVERSSDQNPSEGRTARSWRMTKTAWGIVRSDPVMLVLALIATVFTAASLAVV